MSQPYPNHNTGTYLGGMLTFRATIIRITIVDQAAVVYDYEIIFVWPLQIHLFWNVIRVVIDTI